VENPGVFLVENLGNEMLLEEIGLPVEVKAKLKEAHFKDLDIRRQNVRDLRAIQKVIFLEEAQNMSLDEVLARLLTFYHRFVPYK
jgi:hypothetical protein